MENSIKKKCKAGVCKHYWTCDKDKKEPCERFAECKTYMDKCDNDIELWAELHGESMHDE